MSAGRKEKVSRAHTTGTSRRDILGNLTLADGDRKELARETFKFSASSRSLLDVKQDRAKVIGQATEKAKSLVHLSQENIDTLNVRFKERASEVLRRTAFQGREQLVLTSRT